MTVGEEDDASPKIVVINIEPSNIHNTIKDAVHGVKLNTPMDDLDLLKKGDICIIRQTAGGSRFTSGATRIWYYYDKDNIEGKTEPLWSPSTGWKYKLIMKPLIKQFRAPFLEDFSIGIQGKPQLKRSSKVYGLVNSDLLKDGQGGIIANFRDPILPKRYLKAIIDEKKSECDVETSYEYFNGKKVKINVYEFLEDLAGETSYIKPNRGDAIRKEQEQSSTRVIRRSHTQAALYQTAHNLDPNIVVSVDKTAQMNENGVVFCPTCNALMHLKNTIAGVPVYYCKSCNIGYKIKKD